MVVICLTWVPGAKLGSSGKAAEPSLQSEALVLMRMSVILDLDPLDDLILTNYVCEV